MSRIFSNLVVATLMLMGGLAAMPIASAQAAPILPTRGDAVLELYLTGDALGGTMTTTVPTSDTATRKSLIASAINPALSTRVTLGKFVPAADMKFTSDSTATIYISSATAMVYNQIQAQISDGVGGASKANTATTLGATALQTSVTRLMIPLATRGVELTGGKTYAFELFLFGVSAAGTPTELFISYGSKGQPSGIVGAINNPAAFPTASQLLPVFLDDRAMTFTQPSATEDKVTNVPFSCATGPCLGSSSAVVWGETKATEAFKVAGETVLTLYVGPSSTGVARGFSATLLLGGSSFTGSTLATFAHTWPTTAGTSAPRVYRFSFATYGTEVAAGDRIGFSFSLWSTTDTPAGSFRFLYGSVGRPAGLAIPIFGGAAPAAASGPTLALSAPSSEFAGTAGQELPGTISVRNDGTGAADVSLVASGDATVAFPDGTSASLAAGASRDLNFTVTVPAMEPGSTASFTIAAMVGGVEAGNMTFTVTVQAPPSAPTSSAAPSSSAAPTTTATNESASLKTQEVEPLMIPTPSGALVLLALVGLSLALRRRRA